jgi:hypothetical protein
MNLYQVAHEIGERLTATFCRDKAGRRPVYGGTELFQSDPHWRDLILFYEYFHGDNGAGIGASHQTGWTGTIANVIQIFGSVTAEDIMAGQVVGKLFRQPAGVNVTVTVPSSGRDSTAKPAAATAR